MRIFSLIIFWLFLQLTLTSCGISKELKEERKNWKFSNWEQEFKNRTLCLCILHGINNKSIQDSIIKYDKSIYNPLAIAVFDSTINELLKTDINQMQSDSAKSIGRFPKDIRSLLEGKRVMNHCIALYQSERLDSVVKVERKNWKKIPNIMDKILDKIPTF